MLWLLLAVGGACGAMARYGIIQFLTRKQAPFYRATFIVNVVGSFLIGLAAHLATDHLFTLMFTVGFLGALTTFSTFAFDAVRLIRAGQTGRALGYIVATLLVSFVCIAVGYQII